MNTISPSRAARLAKLFLLVLAATFGLALDGCIVGGQGYAQQGYSYNPTSPNTPRNAFGGGMAGNPAVPGSGRFPGTALGFSPGGIYDWSRYDIRTDGAARAQTAGLTGRVMAPPVTTDGANTPTPAATQDQVAASRRRVDRIAGTLGRVVLQQEQQGRLLGHLARRMDRERRRAPDPTPPPAPPSAAAAPPNDPPVTPAPLQGTIVMTDGE